MPKKGNEDLIFNRGAKKMKPRIKSGFSAVEFMVIVAILAGLTGIVVPMAASGKGDAKKEQARSDCARIASAVEEFIAAAHCYPTGTGGAATYHFLYTEGEIPLNNALADGPGMPLCEALAREGGGALPGLSPSRLPGADSWGRAYLVNAHGFFFGGESAFVISAGPNGVIDTPHAATGARGDDIFFLLR